jgi:hypothetical protein
MIISHKHRFIFIKTEKTAGTSIEIALSKYCGPDDVITPIIPADEAFRKSLGYRGAQNYRIPFRRYRRRDLGMLLYTMKPVRFYNHMPASAVRKYVDPEVWNSYFKFCFERNPWDKIVSLFYWTDGHKKYDSIQKFLSDGRAARLRGFELYAHGGVPIVDRVFKYESLDSDLLEVSRIVGLPDPLVLPSYKAKGDVRVDKRRYNEILTPAEADTIAKIYAREISYFGYSF